jgi:hypothetical protein
MRNSFSEAVIQEMLRPHNFKITADTVREWRGKAGGRFNGVRRRPHSSGASQILISDLAAHVVATHSPITGIRPLRWA